MAVRHSRETLDLHAIGALGERDRAELDRHLADCPPCRDELERVSDATRAMTIGDEPLEPSTALRQRVLAAALTGSQAPPRKRRLSLLSCWTMLRH